MKRAFASARRARGFTLVELMVALSGGLFLSVVVFALARDASRFYQRETRLASATLAGITGFERLKADIQRASYLTTPNIRVDQLVRPNTSGITDLAGLFIEPDGSNTTDTSEAKSLSGNDAFGVNKSAGQELAPDSIVLAGSYAATDEFPGSIDGSGMRITLSANSPSLARLGFLATSDADVKLTLVQNVFGVGRILRFLEISSRYQSYGVIASVAVVTVNGVDVPQITLTNPLNVQGFGEGSSVNVVNRVRYRIASLPPTSEQWGPLFDASKGAPGEPSRTELVREELGADDAVIGGSLDIAAEYAVDLELGVTGQATPGGSLSYAASSDTVNFGKFFSASGRPQGVRAVRVRMSVRSREADREANIAGPGGGRIYRFKLGTDLGWARVRTFQADVPLPNQATIQW